MLHPARAPHGDRPPLEVAPRHCAIVAVQLSRTYYACYGFPPCSHSSVPSVLSHTPLLPFPPPHHSFILPLDHLASPPHQSHALPSSACAQSMPLKTSPQHALLLAQLLPRRVQVCPCCPCRHFDAPRLGAVRPCTATLCVLRLELHLGEHAEQRGTAGASTTRCRRFPPHFFSKLRPHSQTPRPARLALRPEPTAGVRAASLSGLRPSSLQLVQLEPTLLA